MVALILDRIAAWGGRRGAVLAVVAGFFLAALLLAAYLRPWSTLRFSTWPSGFEAGRIARNLKGGLGYASPFLALSGDNFLSEEPGGVQFPGTAAPATQEAVRGRWPTAWVTPPYVVMWYLAFAALGTYTVAAAVAFQALQIALMALALALGWRLVLAASGPAAAGLALLFLVLYPPTWYFAIEDTHGTALFVVVVLASLLSLGRVLAGGGRGARIAHGLAVGLAILTEPASLLFYVWLEAWAARRLRRAGRPARAALLTTALCCVAVLGPWFVRNLVSLRAPVLFKSNLPMELYYGNNPEASDDSFRAHVRRFPAWSEDERLLLLEIGEPAYARLCLQRALDFMGGNPWATLRLSVNRAVYYWSFNPYRVMPMRPIVTLCFHLALGLWLFATLGLGWRRLEWFDHACLGFFVWFPIAYYATQFMIYRYRYPVEVLLLMAGASAVTRLAGRREPVRATP